jgi:glutathione S-transferase
MRDKHRRAPAELKDVHPLGKSPTVSIEVLGLTKPIVLAESGPIVEYLCEHFGQRMIPKRYPEGKDGGVGAETEDWMNYRVSDGGFISVATFADSTHEYLVTCGFAVPSQKSLAYPLPFLERSASLKPVPIHGRFTRARSC